MRADTSANIYAVYGRDIIFAVQLSVHVCICREKAVPGQTFNREVHVPVRYRDTIFAVQLSVHVCI